MLLVILLAACARAHEDVHDDGGPFYRGAPHEPGWPDGLWTEGMGIEGRGDWGGVVVNKRMSSSFPLPLAAFITAVGGTLFAGIRESYWVPAL